MPALYYIEACLLETVRACCFELQCELVAQKHVLRSLNINIIIQVASNWDIPDDVCIINLWLLSLAKFIYLLLKSLRHCCYNTACPLGNTDCQVYIYHMIKKKL